MRRELSLNPRLLQSQMIFSQLFPAREFAGFGKTGLEPSLMKFRC